MAPRRIFLVAAEPSGDLLARETVEALRDLEPDLELAGIGGGELAKVGLVSPIDIAPLSILGLFDGLKVYDQVVKLADAATEAIIAFKPDAVVLVDSWGFMVRVAQRLRKRAPQIRIIKLVGPQVWATRAGRAKKLAGLIDHLICIHEMEVDYYTPHNLPVTVMGNPALSRTVPGNGAACRAALGLSNEDDLLLVLPGSRPSEIKRVAPVLVDAARIIKSKRPATHILFAPAPSVRAQFALDFPDLAEWAMLAPEDVPGVDMMAAANFALACSGTVTSELAVQGTPFLVGYKTGWLTWMIGRTFLYKPKNITLLNIASDDTEVAPEFVQSRFTPANVSKTALSLISDRATLQDQIDAQNKALSRMGKGDESAPVIAAQAILNAISET